ncbi:MAG: 50S ribosomal protein L9 [Candidatus Azambacteria bacterium]|nr:50S ribosomal protein L9 [Candidatus Azambacteria bacterium]
MKIALLQDVPNLGKRGDIKNVSDGYGRNFLIKKRMADILTPQTEKTLKLEKEKAEKSMETSKTQSLILKEKIEKIKLVLKTKIGESGKTFGSITPAKIVDELEKNNIRLDKNQILSKSIKTIGKHTIKIILPQKIEAELKIIIEP